jgi:hypothetical protein
MGRKGLSAKCSRHLLMVFCASRPAQEAVPVLVTPPPPSQSPSDFDWGVFGVNAKCSGRCMSCPLFLPSFASYSKARPPRTSDPACAFFIPYHLHLALVSNLWFWGPFIIARSAKRTTLIGTYTAEPYGRAKGPATIRKLCPGAKLVRHSGLCFEPQQGSTGKSRPPA